LLDDTLSLCREKFNNHGVALKVNCPYTTETVLCRQTEISQVLINLLNNSFDAVKKMAKKWVVLDIVQQDGLFVFSVTDSGDGIPPDVALRMFDPFFTTKGTGEGTGLGLSISAGIIESHGGHLWLDHEHPHTRFVFTLPSVPPAS
jgi:C4-dicarboxylate-specific signal transduction histidine kinase